MSASKSSSAKGRPRDDEDERTKAGGGEEASPEADERAARGEVEYDIEALLQQARKERDEYLDLAQRTKADFDNYRKRVTRDISEARQSGKNEIVNELLTVIDNLERALAAAQPRDRDHPESHLSEGVRLVYEELHGVLKRARIEAFEPEGERFDPTCHEAVMTKPATDGTEDGEVAEVVQKGYRQGDAILRPAKVVVAKEE